jgi:hypothetical protein
MRSLCFGRELGIFQFWLFLQIVGRRFRIGPGLGLIVEHANFEFYTKNKDMIYTGYKFLFEDQRFGSPNIVVITIILKI